MKTFTINGETIDRVVDGHCIPWNYDYKEYIFNDEYTEAFSLRIPQGTKGIKAILMSNGSGIKEEYDRVYFDNYRDIRKLFDVEKVDEEVSRLLRLEKEVERLTEVNAELYRILCIVRDAIDL
jgi:hypothetical protein